MQRLVTLHPNSCLLFVFQERIDFMLSVSLLTTITKNCAGQWLGQTRVDYVCVRVLTLHRCVHALRVFVCVCACVYCICVCAVCLAASRGCGILVEVVGVVFVSRPLCWGVEGREGGQVNGIWGLAGWLATANCICTINDKVPLCVMVLGGGSWGLPTKSNSLIW